MTGIIKIGEQVVLDHVNCHVSHIADANTPLHTWTGSFSVPLTSIQSVEKIISSRGDSILVLEDGRSGYFICTNRTATNTEVVVHFQGTGLLSKK